jgi:VCBS repeat protein
VGLAGRYAACGDYDGDGKTDYAVWRPCTGTWYLIPSGDPEAPLSQQWGESGDVPISADFDGDSKTDYAVWRESTGTWYVIPSGTPSAPIVQQFGLFGDIPQ